MARKKLSKVSIFVAIFCCFVFAMSFLTGCGKTNSDNMNDEPENDKPTIDEPIQDEPVQEEKPKIKKLPMDSKYVAVTVRTTPGATYVYYKTDLVTIEYRYWQVDISVSPLRSNIIFQDACVMVRANEPGKDTRVALDDRGYGTASYTISCKANQIFDGDGFRQYGGYVLIPE